jgi:hypothetical protein
MAFRSSAFFGRRHGKEEQYFVLVLEKHPQTRGLANGSDDSRRSETLRDHILQSRAYNTIEQYKTSKLHQGFFEFS